MKQTAMAFAFAAALASGALFGGEYLERTVDGLHWRVWLQQGSVTIYNAKSPAIPVSTTGVLEIPSSFDGYPVEEIGERAFDGCSGLTGVKIPDSVRIIGYMAFNGCSGIENVTIPKCVTKITNYAFAGCSRLKSFSVATGNPAFTAVSGMVLSYDGQVLNCGVNGDVVVPDGVVAIGAAAFCEYGGLKSVVIPRSVTSIRSVAFFGCSGLTSVKMPKIAVADNVFQGCPESMKISYWDYSLALKPNSAKRGTVAGGGRYVPGDKATIKATANSGYAFVGWFSDKECSDPLNPPGYDNRSPTVKYTMPGTNTTIYAKFVTAAEDKDALRFSSATKKLAKTAAKATAGAAFSLKLGISSVSLPNVTAKDLPKGLSIDKRTGEISGTPTKPGEYTATVTVKTASGNKIVQDVKVSVSMPSWAKGTFYGTARLGSRESDPQGYLKFTVGLDGKVSGKIKHKGKWRAFTSSVSYCEAKMAKFTPKVKIDSSTFKPGAVNVVKVGMNGLAIVTASDKNAMFVAQKKSGLLKEGKALAALVGKSFEITKSSNAELGLKKGDKLVVKLGSGDKATVSGVVGGSELTALSWAALVAEKGSYGYMVYVDIIAPGLKRACTLVLEVHLDSQGGLMYVINLVH